MRPAAAAQAEGHSTMFELAPAYLAIQREARELAQRLEPLAAEADESSEVHAGVLALLRESRLCQLMVPADYGGRSARIDPLAICVAREALMAASSHADSLFALQGIGSYAITAAGSAAQRESWLPRIARGEALAALAITEPDAGSDLKMVTTEAVADADGFRLGGAKSFISNGASASFFTVFAREGDGHSMFLVPAGTPGMVVTPTPELIAPHVLGDIRFDGVRLPRDARIGAAGQGFELVLATLSTFRVSVAGAAVGLAQAALEVAARHARTRQQFGRPLARHGPVAQLLADSWTEVEMARLLAYRAACRAVQDPAAALPQSSMAKLAATEAASRVVDRCVQVMGRFGLVRGSRMERLYRQARPMRVYEGASEVLRLGIARQLVDQLP